MAFKVKVKIYININIFYTFFLIWIRLYINLLFQDKNIKQLYQQETVANKKEVSVQKANSLVDLVGRECS